MSLAYYSQPLIAAKPVSELAINNTSFPTGSVDVPAVSAPTLLSHTQDQAEIQWTITMAGTGVAASQVIATVLDANDLGTPLVPSQTITAGIGLGQAFNVTFNGIPAVNGAVPREIVLRVDVS